MQWKAENLQLFTRAGAISLRCPILQSTRWRRVRYGSATFGVLELQAGLVLLRGTREAGGLVEQANPLLVVERDGKAAEAVNADAALLAHFEIDGARTAAFDSFPATQPVGLSVLRRLVRS